MLPVHAPQPRLELPPGELLPPSIADTADQWNEVRARYVAAVLRAENLNNPAHDEAAQRADDAAVLAAAKAGEPSPGRTATTQLRDDRAAAAAELEAASALLLDLHDPTLAAIRAAAPDGRDFAAQQIADARDRLDAYLAGVENLHRQWRQALRLAAWWDAIASGKLARGYAGDVTFGSVQIAGESIQHADAGALLDGFRREAATVAALLDRAGLRLPADEPQPAA